MTNEPKKEEHGSLWNFIIDVGNGRQISTTWNMPKGATKEDINGELDKIRSVMDRQQAKSAALAAGQEIDQLELRLSLATGDLDRIDKSRVGKSLAASERQQREAAVIHLEKSKKDIDFKKGVLSKLLDEAK